MTPALLLEPEGLAVLANAVALLEEGAGADGVVVFSGGGGGGAGAMGAAGVGATGATEGARRGGAGRAIARRPVERERKGVARVCM